MTMTKHDLVQIVMDNADLNRVDAIKFVEDFFEVMIQSLEQGDKVKVPGFGNFILRNKKARVGRNPKTKEEFPIEARRVVSFRASSLLKTTLKETQQQEEVS